MKTIIEELNRSHFLSLTGVNKLDWKREGCLIHQSHRDRWQTLSGAETEEKKWIFYLLRVIDRLIDSNVCFYRNQFDCVNSAT